MNALIADALWRYTGLHMSHKEVTRSHPRAREEGAWYCQTCGELLEDVLPVRVLRKRGS